MKMESVSLYHSIKERSASRPSMDSFNHFLDEEIANIRKVQYKNSIQLYNFKDIPNFLSDNPYILHGYRVFLSYSLCLKSLFVWSNETINIWSHLLGFILFFYFMIYDIIVTIPLYKANITDYLALSFGLLCFQYCMLCSSGYHIFKCHSERSCQWWLGIDMCGISIGVIGCYIPALWYAYYCSVIWRDIYIFTISVLTLCSWFLQRQPEFKSNRWFHLRIIIYSSLCASGIIPTIHWIFLSGGFSAKIVQLFIPKIIVLYLLGMIALSFYLSRFPERVCPGKFDMVGSSHQCWHFVVVFAFLWIYYAGKEIFLYRITNSCVV